MEAMYKSAGSAQMDGGSVKGYASTFDREPDSYGDVVAKGAFEESLKHWESIGKPIPLLYGHNTDDPEYNIGKVTLAREDDRGLYVEAEFDDQVLDAAPVELADGTKANELRKMDLFEVSLVQIPANQHAEVVEVKDAQPGQKSGRRNSKADEDELRRIREMAEAIAAAVDGLIGEMDEPEPEPEEPEAAEEVADEPSAKAQDAEGQVDAAEDDGFEAYKQAIIDSYKE